MTAIPAAPHSASPIPPPDNPPSPYETLVRADTLALLFKQSFPAVFYSLGIGALMCWILWGRLPAASLQLWLGALAGGFAIRLAMFIVYFRAKPAGEAVLGWKWPYIATLVLAAGVWGFGAPWLLAQCDEVAQLIILFFIIGMTAGAVTTYSAHRGITITAMLVVMVPSMLWLVLQPGQMAPGMALGGTLFILGAIRGTQVLAEAMRNQIEIGYRLKSAHDAAQKLARADALTGLNNRRAFMEVGEGLAALCRRNATPCSCLLVDVDHFKQVNDVHGHAAGDLVLQHIGNLLTREFRASDVAGRLGGEEFAVMLPDTDSTSATQVADKFRLAVAAHSIKWQKTTIQVTVSIGVATRHDGLADLLQHADAAMYQAKGTGRNRVVCHG